MLPSMPLLFSLSNSSIFPTKSEPLNTFTSNEDVNKASISTQKIEPSIPISNSIPNIAFENLPIYEKECEDELILLAENSFDKKRKKTPLPTSPRKKKKFESNQSVIDVNDEEHFAIAYFMKLKSELDEATFQKFIALLSEVNDEKGDVVALYKEICTLLVDYPDLVNEFVGFLNPTQALLVGKLTENLEFKQTWSFFKKLDAFHFNRLYHLLEQRSTNLSITHDILRSTLQSSFKGHPNITEGVLGLLPDAKPALCSKEDFDDISNLTLENNAWETLSIKDDVGKGCVIGDCVCTCHFQVVKKFCTFCNIKFSKGQIFVQTGKGLRFAKVSFKDSQSEEVLQRLNPAYYNKPPTCKRTKSTSHSSDEVKKVVEQTPKNNATVHVKAKEPEKLPCKDAIELEKLEIGVQEEIIVENPLVYENLNLGEQVIVSEDIIIESSNSEEAEDIEFETDDEFILELSPITVKTDDSTKDSSSHALTEESRTFQLVTIENKLKSAVIIEDIDNAKVYSAAEASPAQSNEGPSNEKSKKDTLGATGDIEIKAEPIEISPYDTQQCKTEIKEEGNCSKVWTREEDKVILQVFQRQLGSDQTFSEISELLPSRSVDDIQGRFQVLMSFLEKMTSGCYEG